MVATKGATIDDIIEVNDMYVESIKAKLSLLSDFKWKYVIFSKASRNNFNYGFQRFQTYIN